MLIDWLTLKICSSKVCAEALGLLRADANTILCISPDGQLEWETIGRVNIKSDSHQLNISVGGFVMVTGSPARFMPDEFEIHDNVFGSTDIVHGANLMLSHIEKTIGFALPNYKEWDLTRVDITQNYFLKRGNFDIERTLNHLRSSDMGKYRTATFADSCYYQKGNKIQSGKVYAKGRQIIKDFRKRVPELMEHLKEDLCFDSVLCQLALDQVCADTSLNDFEILEKTKHIHSIWSRADEASKRIKLCEHILRFEATFGSRYWNEKNKKTGTFLYKIKPWYNYTHDDLKKLFDDYFDTRIGKGLSVKDIGNLKQTFIDESLKLGYSRSMGVSAYKTMSLIKTIGKHAVYSKNNPDSLLVKSTFYKHRKIALASGLTLADFESGVILPFKRDTIEFIAVNDWQSLIKLAS